MAKAKNKKAKHVPLRTCIATGKKLPKKELVRFVLVDDNKIELDVSGKKKGRGANLSMSMEAFDQAVQRKAFMRAFKLKKPILEEQVNQLRDEFVKYITEKQFRPDNKPVTIKIKKEDFEKVQSKS